MVELLQWTYILSNLSVTGQCLMGLTGEWHHAAVLCKMLGQVGRLFCRRMNTEEREMRKVKMLTTSQHYKTRATEVRASRLWITRDMWAHNTCTCFTLNRVMIGKTNEGATSSKTHRRYVRYGQIINKTAKAAGNNLDAERINHACGWRKSTENTMLTHN